MSRARIEARTIIDPTNDKPVTLPMVGTSWTSRELTPVHDLENLSRERAKVDARIRVAVQAARQAGASWTVIGNALGVTRAAAHKRYGADRLI